MKARSERELLRGLLAFRDGLTAFVESRPADAIRHLRLAERALAAEDNALTGWATYYRAASYYAQGRYPQAKQLLTVLRHRISGRSYRSLEGKAEGLLGLIYNTTGQPEMGSRYNEAALAIFLELKETANSAYAHALIGESYDILGDYERAWREMYSALRLSASLGFPYRSVQIYNAMADFTLRHGDLRLSLYYQDAAVRSAQQLTNPSFLADVLLWRSLLNSRLGSAAAAELDLQRATEQGLRITDIDRHAQFLGDHGLITGAIAINKRPNDAIEALSIAIARYEETAHWSNLLLAHEARAQAYVALGRITQTRADLKRCLALYQLVGEAITEDSLRIALAGIIEDTFDQMVRLEAVVGKKPLRAVYYVERAKALNYPVRHSEATWTAPASIEVLRRSLPEGVALVQYAVLSDRLLWWVQTATATASKDLLLSRSDLETLVESYLGADWGGSLWRASSDELYRSLIAPWFETGAYNAIIFVPDEVLFKVSFPALWNAASHRYLVEDVVIVLSPSATLFALGSERDRRLAHQTRRGSVVVFADPAFDQKAFPRLNRLQRARAEGEHVRRAFPGSAVIAGEQATPEAFARRGPEADWLHFAGHAVASPDRPLESFLLLAPTDGHRRGIITGREIQALDFPVTRLVVLSACSTVAAPRAAWLGAMSLARPFLAAGVPSVLGSLWEVDDREAERLTGEFYTALHRGLSPAEALRVAQLRLLQEQGRGEIRKDGWPAFELIGGPALNPEN